jgi:hypothetical protein
MTYTTPIFSTLNTLGVDLSTSGYDQPYTATSSNPSIPEYPQQPFTVGQEIIGTNGLRALYGSAATAITLGNTCVLSKVFAATPLTSTIAATSYGLQLGVAMTTLTTGQYGWFQTEGVSANISVTASIAANVALYTTATAGVLGAIATGSSYSVAGITTTTTSAGTAGAYAGVITNLALGAAN